MERINWRYLTISEARLESHYGSVIDGLNAIGSDGYELVQVIIDTTGNDAIYIFKRPEE